MADLKRKYTCAQDGCDFSTIYLCNLKQHKRVHDRVRPFACDHAGCSYSTAYLCNLKQHKRVHDRVRPFACDHAGCDYSTAHLSNLKGHKLVHDGMRPFACDHAGCGYSAALLKNLKQHKRTHDVVRLRPFACDHVGCDYAAAERSHLNRHMRIHLLPYTCDHIGCDKAFSTPCLLAAHVRTHSAAATARCETLPIPGVPGYTVSFDGRVFNAVGDTLAQVILAGYASVNLSVEGTKKMWRVHRLVALAFHGPPPDDSYTSVDHVDREKTNNAASNLRWATPAIQLANRTLQARCLKSCRPVVFTSLAGQVTEFVSFADAVKTLGLPRKSNLTALQSALRSGETVQYKDTMREGVIYRPIPAHFIEGKEGYCVGNDGSVMSPSGPGRNSGRVTFGTIDAYGYYTFMLVRNHLVHRLVAAAFLPADAARPLVNHINGVKTDNRVCNLEYATHSENVRHAYATGLAKNVRSVIGTLASGAETQFPSISEAARVIGGKPGPIHRYLRGRRKSAYCGYTWKYVT